MQKFVIGVDIGTGSCKAVALQTQGGIAAVSQFYYPANSPQPGYSEQAPELIWQAFSDCIKEISSKIKQAPLAISFSSCMHSLIAIDSFCKPITPLITWSDTRSRKIAEDIRNSAVSKNIYRDTGTPVHAMSPLCKIIWLRENEPELFKKAFKFISIKEFIWYRLFSVFQIDCSIASATGLFHIENFDWNIPSLQLCGITPAQLSEIVSTTYVRNDLNPAIAADLQIPIDTSFCIGASDGCLANIGSAAMSSGIAALTIGTSGAVRIAGSKPIVNDEAMIFNYVLDNNTFISGGPINNGGNILKWLFKTFLNKENPVDKDYEDLFKKIEDIPAGCQGLIFLPYLYGERSPVWDENASALFFGIKSYHTNAHFLRAAIEGICYALKSILEIIEEATLPVVQLNVSGGFVHSKIWMQLLADVTGKKIYLMQAEDASSIGAALLYMKQAHLINDYTSLMPESYDFLHPDKENYILYEKYFDIFKKLYQPLKASMHQLQKII